MTTLCQTGLNFARAWEACKRLREADLAGITHGMRGLPLDVARCVLDRLQAQGRVEAAWMAADPPERERFRSAAASLGWEKVSTLAGLLQPGQAQPA